ncbi:hypothetical protein DFJ74DRAFT_716413, partial [Hyaloraphidium curvatum]
MQLTGRSRPLCRPRLLARAAHHARPLRPHAVARLLVPPPRLGDALLRAEHDAPAPRAHLELPALPARRHGPRDELRARHPAPVALGQRRVLLCFLVPDALAVARFARVGVQPAGAREVVEQLEEVLPSGVETAGALERQAEVVERRGDHRRRRLAPVCVDQHERVEVVQNGPVRVASGLVGLAAPHEEERDVLHECFRAQHGLDRVHCGDEARQVLVEEVGAGQRHGRQDVVRVHILELADGQVKEPHLRVGALLPVERRPGGAAVEGDPGVQRAHVQVQLDPPRDGRLVGVDRAVDELPPAPTVAGLVRLLGVVHPLVLAGQHVLARFAGRPAAQPALHDAETAGALDLLVHLLGGLERRQLDRPRRLCPRVVREHGDVAH